jgi:hypothetical protein
MDVGKTNAKGLLPGGGRQDIPKAEEIWEDPLPLSIEL